MDQLYVFEGLPVRTLSLAVANHKYEALDLYLESRGGSLLQQQTVPPQHQSQTQEDQYFNKPSVFFMAVPTS